MAKKIDTTNDTADHRPDVYREGDKWVFRASSFGGCMRSLVLSAMGETKAPMPDVVRRGMDEGVEAEPVILKALGSRGWRMLEGLEQNVGVQGLGTGTVDGTGQLALEMPIGNKAIIRCHPDGIGKLFKVPLYQKDRMGELRVVEAKAIMNPEARVWEREYYAWQVSIEMAVTGLPLLFAVGAKEGDESEHGRGVVLPENVQVTEMDTAPRSIAQIKARAFKLCKMLDEAVREGVLPDCDVKQWPCGFYGSFHAGQKIWEEEEVAELEVDVATKVEAEVLLKRLAMAKINMDRAKKESEAAKAELDALVRATSNWDGHDEDTARVTTYGLGDWRIVHRVAAASDPYTVTPKKVDRVEYKNVNDIKTKATKAKTNKEDS